MAFKDAGIDFEAIARRMYEEASPEQRARIDAAEAARARAEATRGEIEGHFERLAAPSRFARRGPGPAPEPTVEWAWIAPVSMTIEGEPGAESIRFRGAVTGYESYRIDESFRAMLEDPEENRVRPRFYLCAGTPGRYDACWVEPAAVAAYLRERRPELYAAPADETLRGMAP